MITWAILAAALRLCSRHPVALCTPTVAAALLVTTGARDPQTAIARLRAHDPTVVDLRTAVEAIIRMWEEKARREDDPAMRQSTLNLVADLKKTLR